MKIRDCGILLGDSNGIAWTGAPSWEKTSRASDRALFSANTTMSWVAASILASFLLQLGYHAIIRMARKYSCCIASPELASDRSFIRDSRPPEKTRLNSVLRT